MPPVSCALAGWRMRLIPNGLRSEPGRPSGGGHAAATCLIDARFHAKLVSHRHSSAWRSCKVCCCQVRHPVALPGSFLCVRRVSFQNHLSPARTTPAYEMGPVHACTLQLRPRHQFGQMDVRLAAQHICSIVVVGGKLVPILYQTPPFFAPPRTNSIPTRRTPVLPVFFFCAFPSPLSRIGRLVVQWVNTRLTPRTDDECKWSW